MARAVVAALRDGGFASGTIVARNERTGRELADRYGFAWQAEADGLQARLVVNATPIGMAGGPDAAALPLPERVIDDAETIFDVVAMPAATPMIERANP